MTTTPTPPDNPRLDRIERILEAIASNQLEERDRRLELREDLEILYQRQQQFQDELEAFRLRQEQTQSQVDITTAQLQTLSAEISILQSQWIANYAAEAQARTEFRQQMLGLQAETRNILREMADLRRQERRNGGENR